MRKATRERALGPYREQRAGGGEAWVVRLRYPDGRKDSKETFTREKHGDARKAALKFIRTFSADVIDGQHTVEGAVDAYVIHRELMGDRARTIETIKIRLAKFFDTKHNANRPLSWLYRQGRGEELYAQLRTKGSTTTHLHTLRLVKRFVAFLLEKGWITSDTYKDIKPVGKARHGGSKPALTIDESRMLLDEVDRANKSLDVRVAVRLGLYLGSRASELTDCLVRDVDDGGHILHIWRGKTANASRVIEIPDSVRPLMAELIHGRDREEPLFRLRDGSKANRGWLKHHVKSAAAKIGLKATPQVLRRTQARIAMSAGVAAHIVQATIGHRIGSSVTQQAYTGAGPIQSGTARRVADVVSGRRPSKSADESSASSVPETPMARIGKALQLGRDGRALQKLAARGRKAR